MAMGQATAGRGDVPEHLDRNQGTQITHTHICSNNQGCHVHPGCSCGIFPCAHCLNPCAPQAAGPADRRLGRRPASPPSSRITNLAREFARGRARRIAPGVPSNNTAAFPRIPDTNLDTNPSVGVLCCGIKQLCSLIGPLLQLSVSPLFTVASKYTPPCSCHCH